MLSWRFVAGVTLIVVNYPLGWGGVIAGMIMYRKTQRRWWCLAGTGVYGLSWILLAAGIYLAGSEGMAMVRKGGWPLSFVILAVIVLGFIAFRQIRRRSEFHRHARLLREEMRLGCGSDAARIDNTVGKNIQ